MQEYRKKVLRETGKTEVSNIKWLCSQADTREGTKGGRGGSGVSSSEGSLHSIRYAKQKNGSKQYQVVILPPKQRRGRKQKGDGGGGGGGWRGGICGI